MSSDAPRLIYENSTHDVSMYLMMNQTEFFYITLMNNVCRTRHRVAYLNIDKGRWDRVCSIVKPGLFVDEDNEDMFSVPEIIRLFDVTFQGVGGREFFPPSSISNRIPFEYRDYWVGFDWRDRIQPDDASIFLHLSHFVTWIQEQENA